MPVFAGEAFFVDRISNPNVWSAASSFNQGHELRHQTAAGHAFRVPGRGEDVTPDKLASRDDWLALHRNAGGEPWHRVIQGCAREIRVRARYGHKLRPTCRAFGFHRLDAVDKLRRRLTVLQHHPLIAARRLPCHGTNKGMPG